MQTLKTIAEFYESIVVDKTQELLVYHSSFQIANLTLLLVV